MQYGPKKTFVDAAGSEERIGESPTAGAWWAHAGTASGRRDNHPDHPSARTKRSSLSTVATKSSWPVYLTIGKHTEGGSSLSFEAHAIVARILASDEAEDLCEEQAEVRNLSTYSIDACAFSWVLCTKLVARLRRWSCADKYIRDCYLFLVGNVCDHPEQCLIACCQENFCPTCDVHPKERGDPLPGNTKDTEDLTGILHDYGEGLNPKEFDDLGLRPVPKPYWAGLPHCDIGMSFAPDLLHQMYKGVFKEHLVSWCTTAIAEGPSGEREVDARFNIMPNHSDVRHFRGGISAISQWTGNEHKEMAKVFYGILIGAVDSGVAAAAKAILDFIMYSRLQVHTSSTLRAMEQALEDFHLHKEIFIEKGIRDQFDIPKVHSMVQYIDKIRWVGTTDGFQHRSDRATPYRSRERGVSRKQQTRLPCPNDQVSCEA